MSSAEDAVTTSQLTSVLAALTSCLLGSERWMQRSRPPFGRMELKSDLILSTCIVRMRRLGSDVVLISWTVETERQPGPENRERERIMEDSTHSSVVPTPSRKVDVDRKKQATDKTQAVGIHIPIHSSSRGSKSTSDATRGPKVYFGHYPSPAFLPSSPRLGNSPLWIRGSSGRNPWHGCQASRLLSSTVAPFQEARRQFPSLPRSPLISLERTDILASTIPAYVSNRSCLLD
ncbi:hypothetical protein B0T18DRAFT_188405 [Schizothecium vesticola]|uniref:Uncharacterized protein n=1 Tax=Schizothecium vesticola TaxID=314040 RepID=A0AA40K2R0_9PEZI|nr:hypothetical protein B0T18DRAFT_188405 [Schizothecium vesticola]